MMQTKPKDTLLAAAKTIIILIQLIVIFAIVMIAIGIGAILTVGRARVLAQIAEVSAPTAAYPLLLIAFALIIALLALAYRFFRQLTGIIDSVGQGDPFRLDNAERLTRMGWLSVGAQALGLVLAGIAAWFAPYIVKSGHDPHMGFGIELTGVLLTLILFILARVFRQGAAMREELEGTV
jgi:hypothetical protein